VLEFGVLSPVRAVRDGRELGLGGPKPRAVLALLLVDAGRVVPAEYLAEVLWRGAMPPGATKTLRSYVSRLRSLLEPEAALVAQGGVYAITVGPDWVDAARFERLVGAGKTIFGNRRSETIVSLPSQRNARRRTRQSFGVTITEEWRRID
jgi:DNA-binding SARP family transcriptional activator